MDGPKTSLGPPKSCRFPHPHVRNGFLITPLNYKGVLDYLEFEVWCQVFKEYTLPIFSSRLMTRLQFFATISKLMIKRFLGKLLDSNESKLAALKPLVDKINKFEPSLENLSADQLKNKTIELKQRLVQGDSLDDLLPEAFALVREAAKRSIGQRHFDVQLMGGIILHQGKIAEMRTGEGKTLVATLPLYLNALEGKGSHLVTVNDFLAKFHAQWMGRIYHLLGLSVSAIGHEQSFVYRPQKRDIEDQTWSHLWPITRKEAYLADICYGTNNEFGFDYLRDNMASSLESRVGRDLNFAIIDEIDSILIDEARTPLIISAPSVESAKWYQQFAALVPKLKKVEDFSLDEKLRSVSLTDQGIKKMERWLGVDNLYQPAYVSVVHYLEQSLKANFLYHQDKDYVAKDGQIVIVDEFTGRLMEGRRYSEGLHQAIEAKEGLEVNKESITLATITFQNLFRLYTKLAGMTGTAETEKEEFYKIYQLDVVVVPTNRPMIRLDHQDQIFKTEQAKFQAVVDEVKRRHERGQPLLIGTASIQKNEILSDLLIKSGVKHNVLNAKNHYLEARIIAQAGAKGAVTLATNIAGRGVDIILGGTPPSQTSSSGQDDRPDEGSSEDQDAVGLEVFSSRIRDLKGWEKEHQEVVELGGLTVIGTERHESRRIDNQLRGRTGRQGDPGETIFYVSMEDDLMRIFGGDRMKGLMDRLGLPDNQPIEHKLVSRSIEQAQKKVEGHNFDIRKHLLEYDDVLNRHREAIYRKRREILEFKGRDGQGQPISLHQEGLDFLADLAQSYSQKMKSYPADLVRKFEQAIYLRVIDTLWIEHLTSMTSLRESIGLRGWGQKDPLTEYKHEAYSMYQKLLSSIEFQVADSLKNLEIEPLGEYVRPVKADQPAPIESQGLKRSASPLVSEQDGTVPATLELTGQSPAPLTGSGNVVVTVRQKGQTSPLATFGSSSGLTGFGKVGRNEKCPCGSGKKYKKCHGR